MPFIAIALVLVGVAADYSFKNMAVNFLQPVGELKVIPGFFHLTYVQNPGAAFGILANQKWLFIILTAVVCLAILAALFLYRNHNWLSYCASILILIGGIGNLIDRIMHGYVVDYLHVLFFPPVFNFADICVTVGTCLLILYILFFSEKEKKKGYGKYRKYANYSKYGRNGRNW